MDHNAALTDQIDTAEFQNGREPRRARAKEVRVALGDYAAIFWAQEPNKLMKDKAARGCRVLCRDRVAEELERRRGTPIAEHLKLVLTIIDPAGAWN